MVQRTPFLPDEAFEVGALFRYEMISDRIQVRRGLAGLLAGYRIDAVEFHVAVGLHVFADDPIPVERERLASVAAGGTYVARPDLGIGGELAVAAPVGESPSYSVHGVLTRKLRLTPRSAIELRARPGLGRATWTDESGSASITTLVLGGDVRAQAQVLPAIAIEGRASLYYIDSFGELGDRSPFTTRARLSQSYGIRVIGAVTPYLDGFASLDVTSVSGYLWRAYTIGVTARRVP